MKSSLYFGVKLEQRALLQKLKRSTEKSNKIPKNKKFTQNKTTINQSKINQRKTKLKCLVNFLNRNSQYPIDSPRQRRQKLDRPQVYGCCSVDQVSSHRDYTFGFLSFLFQNLLSDSNFELTIGEINTNNQIEILINKKHLGIHRLLMD